MIRILIVEDELEIQESIKIFLENKGYSTVVVDDGIEAIELFDDSINLVLLDLMLPKLDGFGVCEVIRSKSDVPIIMLTALDEEEQQIRGFTLKIDDYITKPFSFSILLYKIEAVLRRTNNYDFDNNLVYKDLKIDLLGKEIFIHNKKIELTAKEYSIILELFSNQGIVFTRDMIYDKLWGYDTFYDDRVINTHMKNIRRKLNVDYIKTMRGVGYKVERLY